MNSDVSGKISMVVVDENAHMIPPSPASQTGMPKTRSRMWYEYQHECEAHIVGQEELVGFSVPTAVTCGVIRRAI